MYGYCSAVDLAILERQNCTFRHYYSLSLTFLHNTSKIPQPIVGGGVYLKVTHLHGIPSMHLKAFRPSHGFPFIPLLSFFPSMPRFSIQITAFHPTHGFPFIPQFTIHPIRDNYLAKILAKVRGDFEGFLRQNELFQCDAAFLGFCAAV